MSERQSIHRNGVLTPKAKEIANPQFAAAQKASIPMIRRIDESRRLTAKDMAFTCNVTDENGGQMSDKTADMLAAWSWYVVRHSHQIADTGDYYGAWELTNGVISLMTEDDSERDDIQAIANAFNESELDFSLDDKAAIDLYISKQEQAEQIEDLTREVARLRKLNEPIWDERNSEEG